MRASYPYHTIILMRLIKMIDHPKGTMLVLSVILIPGASIGQNTIGIEPEQLCKIDWQLNWKTFFESKVVNHHLHYGILSFAEVLLFVPFVELRIIQADQIGFLGLILGFRFLKANVGISICGDERRMDACACTNLHEQCSFLSIKDIKSRPTWLLGRLAREFQPSD